MSEPEQPPTSPRVCKTPGRRRTATARVKNRSRAPRSRYTCPEQTRLLEPAHEAFADWFVTYWRGRGAELFATSPTQKEA